MNYVEQNARPIGGWLLFIGFSLFLGFFQEIYPIIYASLWHTDVQENLGIFGRYPNAKHVQHVFFASIYGLLIYFFLKKKRKFVKYYVALNVIATFLILFIFFTFRELINNPLQQGSAIFGKMNKLPAHTIDSLYVIFSTALITWSAIICLYMFKSKRVKETFVN